MLLNATLHDPADAVVATATATARVIELRDARGPGVTGGGRWHVGGDELAATTQVVRSGGPRAR